MGRPRTEHDGLCARFKSHSMYKTGTSQGDPENASSPISEQAGRVVLSILSSPDVCPGPAHARTRPSPMAFRSVSIVCCVLCGGAGLVSYRWRQKSGAGLPRRAVADEVSWLSPLSPSSQLMEGQALFRVFSCSVLGGLGWVGHLFRKPPSQERGRQNLGTRQNYGTRQFLRGTPYKSVSTTLQLAIIQQLL
jgi:hypothetical protein